MTACLAKDPGYRPSSAALFEYLEIFHNRQRRHSALEMLTPVEYELRTAPVA
ncbi:IS3 family transposase [Streptomyces sp. UG1]